MKRSANYRLLSLGCLALFASTSGCSLVFVTPPPEDGRMLRKTAGCTSSVAAPVVDSLIGAFQVVRTGLAVAADDSAYADPKQPLTRDADIGIGLGLTALFVGSAAYGFVHTAECRQLEERGKSSDADATQPEDEPAIIPSRGLRRPPRRAAPTVAPTPAPAPKPKADSAEPTVQPATLPAPEEEEEEEAEPSLDQD
jgi:hypothetical protein